METNANFQAKFFTKKIFLEKCVNIDDKLILYFTEKDYKTLSFNQVIIKNIKNREEFICSFIKELPNSLTIDLNNICNHFTDYEGSIFININSSYSSITLIPILPSKNSIILDNKNTINNFKWFIRSLENGELRLSSIVNKKL